MKTHMQSRKFVVDSVLSVTFEQGLKKQVTLLKSRFVGEINMGNVIPFTREVETITNFIVLGEKYRVYDSV